MKKRSVPSMAIFHGCELCETQTQIEMACKYAKIPPDVICYAVKIEISQAT